jgi:hypothetical protein
MFLFLNFPYTKSFCSSIGIIKLICASDWEVIPTLGTMYSHYQLATIRLISCIMKIVLRLDNKNMHPKAHGAVL